MENPFKDLMARDNSHATPDEASNEPTQPIEGNEKNKPSQSAEGSKGQHRKPAEENHIELNESAQEELNKKVAKGRGKRAETSKPEAEVECFPDKRNLEDLWQQVFPVGTEDAFEEGGLLYNQKVYLFGCTKPKLVSFQGQGKVAMIPVVVTMNVISPGGSGFQPSEILKLMS
ncbi:unnamed protein product [Fraxinus pennsylvanica]|uniref:Uncharacterized protein n=1 Tax=Fraxinus pennsylvanica TaxID=56036 RepID=A0AAD1ZY19_9LAMI|nr:unnamed protein product [Fraxinus pennsylvanica]